MKRILIFIGLKVGEIIGAGVALFLVNWPGVRLLVHIRDVSGFNWFEINFVGTIIGCLLLLGCLALLFLFYVIFIDGIPTWIKANWRKAGEISGRKRT